ncbi:MAG: hypothetical protein LH606_10390, partial [Cytophagaceae bacterium]|nr:hypothetical protein [Cytophagaceae bacterium]
MIPRLLLCACKNGIFTFFFCSVALASSGQELTAVRHEARQIPRPPARPEASRALSDVLHDLGEHYDVTFIHSNGLMLGKWVEGSRNLYAQPLARTLQELLEPLGLRFKKIRTRSYAISPIKADTDEKPQSNAVPFVGA